MINTLYLFLKNEFSCISDTANLTKNQFKFKINLAAQEYALYELNVDRKQAVLKTKENMYALESHHLSFYEKEDKYNPYVSQYHYTAYLHDKHKKRYQLHVYFNQKDQLATDTVLSVENAEGIFFPVQIDKEFSVRGAEFAINHSVHLVSELRQLHQRFITELEEDYKKLESELTELSRDFLSQHVAYELKLQKTLDKLDQLIIYPEGQPYQRLRQVFLKIKDQLPFVASANWRKEEAKRENISVEKELPSSSSAPSSKTLRNRRKRVRAKERKLLQSGSKSLASAIQAEEVFLTSLGQASFQQQVNDFLRFHECTYDALLSQELRMEKLQQIQKLTSRVMVNGKELLSMLLLQDQFTLALCLKSYLKPFPSDLAKVAIQKGNARLLEFLLEHGDFPVNTFVIEDHLTPVQYCYLNNSDECPLAECLSVLVKYHASLAVKVDGEFSVAHHILFDRQHPLRQALIENASLTFSRLEFHTMLVDDVDAYIAHHVDRDEEEIKQLSRFALQHKNEIENLKILSAKQKKSKQRHAYVKKRLNEREHAVSFLKKIGIDMDVLHKDADFLSKEDELIIAAQECFKNLSSEEVRRLSRGSQQIWKNVEILLEKCDGDREISKDKMLAELDKIIQLYRLISERHTLNSLLADKKLSKTKGRKWRARVNEVDKELRKLLQPRQRLMDENSDEMKAVADMALLEKSLKDAQKSASFLENHSLFSTPNSSTLITPSLEEDAEALPSEILSNSDLELVKQVCAESMQKMFYLPMMKAISEGFWDYSERK